MVIRSLFIVSSTKSYYFPCLLHQNNLFVIIILTNVTSSLDVSMINWCLSYVCISHHRTFNRKNFYPEGFFVIYVKKRAKKCFPSFPRKQNNHKHAPIYITEWHSKSKRGKIKNSSVRLHIQTFLSPLHVMSWLLSSFLYFCNSFVKKKDEIETNEKGTCAKKNCLFDKLIFLYSLN